MNDQPQGAAKSLEMVGPSALREGNQAIEERIRLVALACQQGEFLCLVFVAPQGAFDPLRLTFDPILRSFVVR